MIICLQNLLLNFSSSKKIKKLKEKRLISFFLSAEKKEFFLQNKLFWTTLLCSQTGFTKFNILQYYWFAFTKPLHPYLNKKI